MKCWRSRGVACARVPVGAHFVAMKAPAVLATVALVGCLFVTGLPAAAASSTSSATAPNRLIVLGRSIAGIRLDESRANVQRALGKGKTTQRGLVSYFAGRLIVNYWFHDALTRRVQGLQTRWAGFHTRSGLHVGSSRARARALGFACGDGTCSREAGPMPDAPGTILTMRHGKVARIGIFYA
jgi:hypothetical protein